MKAMKKKISKLGFKRNSKRKPRKNLRYQSIFDQVAKIKKGESVVVSHKVGQTAKQLQNSLLMATRRMDVKPPRGCRFSCRLTTDGKVAICCVSKT